jgi:hypothetical protein
VLARWRKPTRRRPPAGGTGEGEAEGVVVDETEGQGGPVAGQAGRGGHLILDLAGPRFFDCAGLTYRGDRAGQVAIERNLSGRRPALTPLMPDAVYPVGLFWMI